jgi:hypothetical protein
MRSGGRRIAVDELTRQVRDAMRRDATKAQKPEQRQPWVLTIYLGRSSQTTAAS